MRNINPTALAEINKQYGIESIIVLEIQWPTGSVYYGEKENSTYRVEGRILNTGGIDDVVGVGQSGSSKSVSFTLSDHDGVLKNIFDNVDLHKVRARVLQWFDKIPLNQAFVIFDGQINTPLQWNEGERTLELTVMSLLESREFGFSPDESYFGVVPNGLMGTAWPIAFGTNIRMRALAINEAPQIMLAEGFAIVDKEIWEAELSDLAKEMQAAYDNARSAQQASTAASYVAGTYNNGAEHSYIGLGGVEIYDDPPDDYNTYLQYYQQSIDFHRSYIEYSNEYLRLSREYTQKQLDYEEHKKYAKGSVKILSTNAPRGVPLTIQIGENRWSVVIQGTVMSIGARIVPPKTRRSAFVNYSDGSITRSWEGEKTREKFTWIAGGTKIKVLNLPMKYVVTLGASQVLNVYGRQQGMYVPLARGTYVIQNTPFITRTGQTVFAITITTPQPLTSIQDDQQGQIWEGDDIYVDVVSAIPGRMVDILNYTITNFTNLQIDPASFATARLYTDAIPMNHVVRERKDALQYCEEVAFQGKCAIWINDNTVYLRYMPVEPVPVDTIDFGDILEDSISIFSTETEEVITKYIATWRFTEDQPDLNRIIFRYNMQKYNYSEEEYNFFAFNDPGSVSWSARYWSVRKATVYKKIKFKTDLTKINLEAFDAVTLNLVPMVSCVPVTGIVESAVYNSDSKEIDFVVWLPLRLGEMCPTPFAYPGSEIALYGDPADPGIYTGNPFDKMKDPTNFMDGTYNYYVPNGWSARTPYKTDPINMESPGDSQISVDTFIYDGVMNTQNPLGVDLETANDYKRFEVKPFSGTTLEDQNEGKAFFGIVKTPVDNSNKNYRVQLFDSERIVSAKQILIGTDSPKIPSGTPVMMIRTGGFYYFQAPIWLQPDEV